MKHLISGQLRTRIASATVLMPVAVLIVLYGSWPYALMVFGCAALALYEWAHLVRKLESRLLFLLSGILYILVSAACFYLIRADYGAWTTLLFFLLVWASDTGAYFTGKNFGRIKMAPAVSPNKTWEGMAGAMITPGLVTVLWIFLFDFWYAASPFYYIGGFFLGAVLGAVGQAGDLLISFVKRRAGVKDTGTLIPGHGGLLDRIDSMMLGAPVFLWMASIFSYG